MNHKTYYVIVGCVTGIVALAHLIRVITGASVVVDGWAFPAWLSLIAFLAAGYISYVSFRFASKIV